MSAALFFSVRPSVMTSLRAAGTPWLRLVSPHKSATAATVGFAVGGDHALVDGPGGLDLDVLVACEQRVEAAALLVGEQVAASVQDPPCPVERVGGAAPVAV